MKIIRKYHPWNSKSDSWDDIEKKYIENWGEKHFRLIELVQHIKNSELRYRLYGSTSMDKLVVSIYEIIDYRKEALHINFDNLFFALNVDPSENVFTSLNKPIFSIILDSTVTVCDTIEDPISGSEILFNQRLLYLSSIF